MKTLNKTCRILFILFTLQVGFDGIILSYLSSSDNQVLIHLTNDYSFSSHGHHHHEDDIFVQTSNYNIVLPDTYSEIVVCTPYAGKTYPPGIWQPPKLS